jgi:hypothetical protein
MISKRLVATAARPLFSRRKIITALGLCGVKRAVGFYV